MDSRKRRMDNKRLMDSHKLHMDNKRPTDSLPRRNKATRRVYSLKTFPIVRPPAVKTPRPLSTT